MNEAELSESLIYLTCPICGEVSCTPWHPCRCHQHTCRQVTSNASQVLHNDPVFTPCHHTFCGHCIRDRIKAGEGTCAECHKPLKLEDLKANSMALNLLNSLKARSIDGPHSLPLARARARALTLFSSLSL